jgi:hypothetical protein
VIGLPFLLVRFLWANKENEQYVQNTNGLPSSVAKALYLNTLSPD